jgi:nucleotide-binding universal stress UspA family protein
MHKRKLLIPLDGSPFSRQILPHVRRLLSPESTTLILLRVMPLPEGYVGTPPRVVSPIWPLPLYEAERDAQQAHHPIYASQEQASFEALLESELLGEVHLLQEAGYDVSVAVRFGDPAEEIIAFVEGEEVDLVAMATHGRSGLGQLVLGSVAEVVLRRLAVPLLLVRPLLRPRHREPATLVDGAKELVS